MYCTVYTVHVYMVGKQEETVQYICVYSRETRCTVQCTLYMYDVYIGEKQEVFLQCTCIHGRETRGDCTVYMCKY